MFPEEAASHAQIPNIKRRFAGATCLSDEIYRNKDVVEKAFSDIKGRLNCRRTLVLLERSLDVIECLEVPEYATSYSATLRAVEVANAPSAKSDFKWEWKSDSWEVEP